MPNTLTTARPPGWFLALLSLVAVLGMSLRLSGGMPGTGLRNPDSYMRMTRLRDILDSGTMVSSVARDGSGHGTMLHWSHLIDGLLLALSAPFRLVMDPDQAMLAAALVFGPLTAAATGYAIAWAAAPFARREFLWLGAVMTALAPTIMSYGVIGVVHHHVPAVLAAVICWGVSARLIAVPEWPVRPETLGVWAGVGIWLTPETVPVTIPAFLVLWVACAVAPERNDLPRAIGRAGGWFAAVTLAAWMVDPPASGRWVPEVDRVSIILAGMACAVACAGTGPRLAHRVTANPWARAIVMLAVGAVCTGVWAAIFWPTLVATDMAANSAEQHAFFDAITEMLPIRDVAAAVGYLTTGALAALALVWLAVRHRSAPLAFAALTLLVFMGAGALHVRFTAYPQAAGAIALPIILTLISHAAEATRPRAAVLGRVGAILGFIVVPFLGVLGESGPRGGEAATVPPIAAASCDLTEGVALLASNAGAVVLTDVNDTPEVLYRSRVKTVGSLYHRNIPGFLRLRAAWRSEQAVGVPPEIDAAEVSLILACPWPTRSALVADLPADTLYDRLRAGTPPSWARPIAADPKSGYVLYEIVR